MNAIGEVNQELSTVAGIVPILAKNWKYTLSQYQTKPIQGKWVHSKPNQTNLQTKQAGKGDQTKPNQTKGNQMGTKWNQTQ